MYTHPLRRADFGPEALYDQLSRSVASLDEGAVGLHILELEAEPMVSNAAAELRRAERPASAPVARPAVHPVGAKRTDIQALRALAVGAVLLYHLWPERLTGGYIGVDVFFVISGFLITSHLLRELETTGTLRVAHFWAARARRLLPASLLVLLLSAVATVAVVPAGLWQRFLVEIGASTLYVQNWFLAAQSIDYLGATTVPSPVQHFWTLSVEEQFYFVLPLLVLGAAALAPALRRSRRAVLLTIVGLVTTLSFAASVLLTPVTGASYFSTGTRAWEFGLGALVAFLPPLAARQSLVTGAGIVAILASAILFTGATDFPGSAALLPAGGTALILWAGRDTVLSRVGAVRPVALLGHTSYAIYLWHWPMIVLLPYATGHPLGTAEKAAIIAVTVLLAWLSTRYWEDPIRFSPRLLGGRKPRTVAIWSVAGMSAVLLVLGGSLLVQQQLEASARAAAAAEVAATMASPCFGAAAQDPGLRPCALPEASIFIPSLVGLEHDDDNRRECWSSSGESEFNLCSVGPAEGYSKRILALGDSHSNTLIGAYERIANEHGWRIDIAGHSGCYLTTAALSAGDENGRQACDDWRAAALDRVSSSTPLDAILVTRSSTATSAFPRAGETPDEAQVQGLVEAWQSRGRPEVPIIAILDNPTMPAETYSCLEAAGPASAGQCAAPRAEVLRHDLQRDAAELVPNVHVLDLTSHFCGAERCEAVVGGAVVYRPDGNHITATFARTLAPYIADGILAVLGRPE